MMTGIQKNSRLLLICLVLASVTLAAFWQMKNHEFINYDDDLYVTGNKHVQTGFSVESVRWAFTTSQAANWHPLTWLSHMLDCRLFGFDPAGHHLMNLLLHLANTLLLFLVLHRMTHAIWRSAFVAALFAFHPLHVESVAWIAERKDVLSTFFLILTMGAYARYVEQPGIRRYLPVLVFFIIGLMSKPMLVTLPFVLLLLDYWPLVRLHPAADYPPASGQINPGRKRRKAAKNYTKDATQNKAPDFSYQWPLSRSLVWEKVPLFALSAMSSVITVLHQQQGGALSSFNYLPLPTRMANALNAYMMYLGKMIWPQDLAVFYPYPAVQPVWHVFGAALVLVAITILVIAGAKQFPYLVVGWFWFLGTLVPVIGLVQVGEQAMADRYTYVPAIGIFIMAAWGFPELLQRWRISVTVTHAAACLVVLAFAILTYGQLRHWQDSISLFGHAVSVTTDNATAHINLGDALRDRGKPREVEYHYREALRISSDNRRAYFERLNYYQARYNLGNLLLAEGKTEAAVGHFREALRIKPVYGPLHAILGTAFLYQGRLSDAADYYRNAIRFGYAQPWVYYNLGLVLRRMGHADDAIIQFREAISADLDFAEAYNALGGILAEQGKWEKAAGYFQEAVRINPQYADARDNLKAILSLKRKR